MFDNKHRVGAKNPEDTQVSGPQISMSLSPGRNKGVGSSWRIVITISTPTKHSGNADGSCAPPESRAEKHHCSLASHGLSDHLYQSAILAWPYNLMNCCHYPYNIPHDPQPAKPVSTTILASQICDEEKCSGEEAACEVYDHL